MCCHILMAFAKCQHRDPPKSRCCLDFAHTCWHDCILLSRLDLANQAGIANWASSPRATVSIGGRCRGSQSVLTTSSIGISAVYVQWLRLPCCPP